MHKSILRYPAVMAGALLLLCVSCRGIETLKFPTPKNDSFYVILDKSGSMAEPYKGETKFAGARTIAERMALYAPDRQLNAGLRTFGENYFDFNNTTMAYGVTRFLREDYIKTVRGLGSPMGNSALHSAIKAAGEDLKTVAGRIALIIISDGTGMGEAEVSAAAELKRQFGPRLCIFTVQIGNDEGGGKLLQRLAGAGQCGTALKGDALEGETELKGFWVKALPEVKKAEPAPVVKIEEKRPAPEARPHKAEPAPKKVSPPRGALVLQVLFSSGSSVIKRAYFHDIKKVADFMKEYPDVKVVIEGHTDSAGNFSANMKLSQQRAEKVMKQLIGKYGIDPARIRAVGYGPKRPVASNATEKGREKNRRVEARRISR